MLMDATHTERYNFLARVTADAEPAFRRTQEGDPAKQDWWRANQPMLYAQARIMAHRDRLAA